MNMPKISESPFFTAFCPQGASPGHASTDITGNGTAINGGTGEWLFVLEDVIEQGLPDSQLVFHVGLSTGTNIPKGISWGLGTAGLGQPTVQLYRNDTGAAVDLAFTLTVSRRTP